MPAAGFPKGLGFSLYGQLLFVLDISKLKVSVRILIVIANRLNCKLSCSDSI